MNGRQEQNEIKKLIDELVGSLKERGVNVDGVSVVKIPFGEYFQDKTEKKQKEELFREAFKRAFEKVGKNLEDLGLLTPKGEQQEDETCLCKNCFNFNTFEQVLKDKNGKFDYSQLYIGGKTFDVKFWSNGKEEHIMISDEENQKEAGNEELLEMLSRDLSLAITKGDFTSAQEFLNKINEIKSKKAKN